MQNELPVTIRYCHVSGEYHARHDGKIVGSCVFLKEAGDAGLWKYSVKGQGSFTNESREQALLELSRRCNASYGQTTQVAA